MPHQTPPTRLRCIRLSDIPALIDVIREAGPGLATMPQTPEAFEKNVAESDSGVRPTFVLERLDTHQPVGLSSILTKLPPASHSVTCLIERDENGLPMRLKPEAAAFAGCTELCTLFLQPEFRGGGQGKLLSLGRLMHIANDLQHFSDTLIVELRGVLDEDGVSPLWRAVCDRLFKINHRIAHQRLRDDPAYITTVLSPDGWLGIRSLPEPIRALAGRVHQNTEPARRMLEQQGFADTHYIDLLDAGPVLACKRDQAHTIRSTRVMTVADLLAEPVPAHLIATAAGPFACARAPQTPAAEWFQTTLNLTPQDPIRLLPA